MAVKRKKPDRRGRPHEGRVHVGIYILPVVRDKIDSYIEKDNPGLNTRGKVVEEKFNSVN